MKPRITQAPGGLWICRHSGTAPGLGTNPWRAYCRWLTCRPYRDWPFEPRTMGLPVIHTEQSGT